ncbi:type III secretion system chaperone [Burkholderia oklahomensis]|uniref:Tir chaperone family protein n=1 Tax=Burkholderia oklahomensis TaxID=342113 RepID=A0AAI8B5E1_9BURK|nr:type III secretion system chaperone [Burkholderia oklahomensis]AIO65888.1 tir chaperone family protein [Burkholderia oklahomensis]AOI43705.1 type III secretion protein [Burkholderia oklahomensis EO147]KUY49347.1 type III secretion protein [Burkholderia oklahomensis EO147]QPS38464.1 CesT family type III secretion system chaperone [Burkholderia oklahomensis]
MTVRFSDFLPSIRSTPAPSLHDGATDALLAELARRLGLPGLHFDAHGHCRLLIDESLPILLRRSGAQLIAIGRIDWPLPASASDETLRLLLHAALNPLVGARPGIGWHEELGLVAYRAEPALELTAEALAHRLSDFIVWVKTFPASLREAAHVAQYEKSVIHDRI